MKRSARGLLFQKGMRPLAIWRLKSLVIWTGAWALLCFCGDQASAWVGTEPKSGTVVMVSSSIEWAPETETGLLVVNRLLPFLLELWKRPSPRDIEILLRPDAEMMELIARLDGPNSSFVSPSDEEVGIESEDRKKALESY